MDTQGLAISLQILKASSGAGRQVEIADGESAFTPLLPQARPRPGRVALAVNATYLE
jgi:hypothetical protein